MPLKLPSFKQNLGTVLHKTFIAILEESELCVKTCMKPSQIKKKEKSAHFMTISFTQSPYHPPNTMKSPAETNPGHIDIQVIDLVKERKEKVLAQWFLT